MDTVDEAKGDVEELVSEVSRLTEERDRFQKTFDWLSDAVAEQPSVTEDVNKQLGRAGNVLDEANRKLTEARSRLAEVNPTHALVVESRKDTNKTAKSRNLRRRFLDLFGG